ncbi:MAG TPA: TetR family transcriptional regulator [Solirubrobacteraceae bacterium]|nr:TetR family transcriptional regulator [Solirubrobacteraceae bacterium]
MSSSTSKRGLRGPARPAILRAAAEVFVEQGFKASTVDAVIKRARVSRKTFQSEFTDLADCMMAILDLTLEHTLALANHAFDRAANWRDGMREALLSILAFLESEPAILGTVMIESFTGGDAVLARRVRVMLSFRQAVVASIRDELPRSQPELEIDRTVFYAVLSAIGDHLAEPEPPPLVSLLEPLMGKIVHLAGSPDSWAEETARSHAAVKSFLDARSDPSSPALQATPAFDWGADDGIPTCLIAARATCLRACLSFVAHHPGCSNRDVEKGLQIKSSQSSKTLARLADEGLLIKRSAGAGRPNGWRLSQAGDRAQARICADGQLRTSSAQRRRRHR